MKAPPRLQALVEEGLIDTVVRQLMSGKEAMVFVVRCGEETRCAKIYKEATHRSFRQAVDYTENRKVKNSRSARAMAKGSKFGRQEQESAWQSAEVDALEVTLNALEAGRANRDALWETEQLARQQTASAAEAARLAFNTIHPTLKLLYPGRKGLIRSFFLREDSEPTKVAE
jgi:hypothetical protein